MVTNRNLLRVEDLSVENYREIVRRAEKYESDPQGAAHLCDGKILASVFFKESTRTSTVAQSAIQRLGGGWTGISGTAGIYAEEDEEDTIRAIAATADIMVIRHNRLGPDTYLGSLPIPVVSGLLAGDEHSLCAVWYLYLLQKQFGRIDNLKLGIYGQTKNCRPYKSLEKLLSLFGGQIYEDPLIDGLATPSAVVEFVEHHGGSYRRSKLREFIGDVDFLVVCDGMPSTTEDPTLMEEYNREFQTMKPADLDNMKEGAIFGFMQPRLMTDGRLTVAKELDSDHRVITRQWLEASVWATMAVFTFLLDS
jgi:aspartate carbamoyltransferase catalytic subunit